MSPFIIELKFFHVTECNYQSLVQYEINNGDYVKDQYFGDVNDFRKYGLLRLLSVDNRLRLGICWMLTKSDGGTDGRFLNYLNKPEKYRDCDPELFEWLRQVIVTENDRRTARIEASPLLGSSQFKSDILTDNKEQREDYFSDCHTIFAKAKCDLIFFDPDNGLETRSTKRGYKNSCKYIYWDELCSIFEAGHSVLVYQHFIFEQRDKFIELMVKELKSRTQAVAFFTFRTPHVLFLLASHERHAVGFRSQLNAIQQLWGPKQIIVMEHAPNRT